MNLLMAGMVPTVMTLRMHIASAGNPLTPAFWFVMSMGLLVGFIVAYPMNWWLVANHLKHGMMTVRKADAAATGNGHMQAGMDCHASKGRGQAHAAARADDGPAVVPGARGRRCDQSSLIARAARLADETFTSFQVVERLVGGIYRRIPGLLEDSHTGGFTARGNDGGTISDRIFHQIIFIRRQCRRDDNGRKKSGHDPFLH
jgi:hypothetical protein